VNTTRSLLAKLRMQRVEKGYNLISLPQITLSEEEADRFIDYMVDESAMKNYARIERMNVPQKNIRAIGFGSGKFLYPAGQFNESKYKKQWVDNKISLSTKEVRGAVAIFDSDLEDLPPGITPDQYQNQLMGIITKKISMELEEAFYIADTHGINSFGADDIRSLWDGWRYRIVNSAVGQAYYNKVSGSAHLLDACEGGTTGSPFNMAGLIAQQAATAPYNWEFKYHKALKAMPSKYKANGGLSAMSFLNSDLVTQDYLAALSARSTGIGDAVLMGTINPQYGRVGIIDVPLMPTNLGDPTATPSTDGVLGAGDYTDCLLTPKGNLIIAIQRDIKIESKREPADQCTYVFYSMRVDVALENVDAVVLIRCLEHEC
jgi:hypothetical protein